MEITMYDKLLQLPLFQGLCQEDFTSILEKVRFEFNKYPAGSCIAQQGKACKQLIFILQGTVYAKSIDNEHGYVLYETFDSPQVIEPYSLFGMFPQYTASIMPRQISVPSRSTNRMFCRN